MLRLDRSIQLPNLNSASATAGYDQQAELQAIAAPTTAVEKPGCNATLEHSMSRERAKVKL